MSASLFNPVASHRRVDPDPATIHNAKEHLRRLRQHLLPDLALIPNWDAVYRSCNELIRKFTLACGVPVSELDDCQQLVWQEVLTAIMRLDYDPSRGQFKTWLYTLVHSKAVDFIRRRQNFHLALSDTAAMNVRSRDRDPAVECEASSIRDAVHECLSRLERETSQANFTLFRLRYLEEMTLCDIAKLMGMTPRQVSFRLHRLRKRCRTLLGHLHWDSET